MKYVNLVGEGFRHDDALITSVMLDIDDEPYQFWTCNSNDDILDLSDIEKWIRAELDISINFILSGYGTYRSSKRGDFINFINPTIDGEPIYSRIDHDWSKIDNFGYFQSFIQCHVRADPSGVSKIAFRSFRHIDQQLYMKHKEYMGINTNSYATGFTVDIGTAKSTLYPTVATDQAKSELMPIAHVDRHSPEFEVIKIDLNDKWSSTDATLPAVGITLDTSDSPGYGYFIVPVPADMVDEVNADPSLAFGMDLSERFPVDRGTLCPRSSAMLYKGDSPWTNALDNQSTGVHDLTNIVNPDGYKSFFQFHINPLAEQTSLYFAVGRRYNT